MASNFAGVQGADDSRNDIIVRGILLWCYLQGRGITGAPNLMFFAVLALQGS